MGQAILSCTFWFLGEQSECGCLMWDQTHFGTYDNAGILELALDFVSP